MLNFTLVKKLSLCNICLSILFLCLRFLVAFMPGIVVSFIQKQ